jgi:precorrin-2 methylase
MGDRYHPSGLPDPGDEEDPLLYPDRRKHGYKELENKLDRHAEEIKSRLEKFIRRGLVAFAIIGIFTALALFGFRCSRKF